MNLSSKNFNNKECVSIFPSVKKQKSKEFIIQKVKHCKEWKQKLCICTENICIKWFLSFQIIILISFTTRVLTKKNSFAIQSFRKPAWIKSNNLQGIKKTFYVKKETREWRAFKWENHILQFNFLHETKRNSVTFFC